VNIIVKARHMEVTEAIRQYVQSKASKLPRYYDNVRSIEVLLDMEADKPLVEILVTAGRKNTFVATHRGGDMYNCVDQSLHKIVEQLRRHKDKVRHHQGPSRSEALEDRG